MASKLKQNTFYLTDELMKAVAFKAIQDNSDKSSVVRDALMLYLADVLEVLVKMEGELAMTEEEKAKKEAWDNAIGLVQVDGDYEPAPALKEMIEKEIRGEITTEELEAAWTQYRIKSQD